MKKGNKIIIFIGFPILIILFYVAEKGTIRKGKEYYNKFSNANIKEVLSEDADIWNKGEKMTFKDGRSYVFYPIPIILNEFYFGDIAKKGDSIIKLKNSDTLILKKNNGMIYKYIFIKSK